MEVYLSVTILCFISFQLVTVMACQIAATLMKHYIVRRAMVAIVLNVVKIHMVSTANVVVTSFIGGGKEIDAKLVIVTQLVGFILKN